MKILTREQISAYEDFLRAHDNFIVTGHKDPDGDCVSSILVASEILKFLKKDFILLSAGAFKRAEIRQFEGLFPIRFLLSARKTRKIRGFSSWIARNSRGSATSGRI